MLESVGPASATDNFIYAVDVFMCGEADPEKTKNKIMAFYKSQRTDVSVIMRGQ